MSWLLALPNFFFDAPGGPTALCKLLPKQLATCVSGAAVYPKIPLITTSESSLEEQWVQNYLVNDSVQRTGCERRLW
jgi:hypothetical protein